MFTVPAVEKGRYYALQFIDMYTYVGSRATGNGVGSYLLAGVKWKGEKPRDIKSVIQSETDFAFTDGDQRRSDAIAGGQRRPGRGVWQEEAQPRERERTARGSRPGSACLNHRFGKLAQRAGRSIEVHGLLGV